MLRAAVWTSVIMWTLFLIFLRVAGLISWPWWCVTLPLLAPLALVVLLGLLVVVCILVRIVNRFLDEANL